MLTILQVATGWAFAENIIVTALTTGFILALIKLIRDWTAEKNSAKHESKKKEEEAKQEEETTESASIKNELDKISLGDKYIESSKQIIELLKSNAFDSDSAFKKIYQKLDEMSNDIILIKREQTDQKEYLNGQYGEWLRNKYKQQ